MDLADGVYGARRVAHAETSREKLTRVLRATTDLLGEGGSVAVTTTAVAERAGVSVGWVYTYFENRESLLEEILVTWLRNLDIRLDGVGFSLGGVDWRDKAAAGIDVHIDYFGSESGFRQMWFSTEWSGRMTQANRQHDTALARYLARSVSEMRHDAPKISLNVVAEIFIGMLDKGVDLAYRDDPKNGNTELLAEMKRSSIAYLEQFLP